MLQSVSFHSPVYLHMNSTVMCQWSFGPKNLHIIWIGPEHFMSLVPLSQKCANIKFCIGYCISMVIWPQKCAIMIFGSRNFLLLVIWSQKCANLIFLPSISISVLIVWNTEWYLPKAQQNFLYSYQKCWEYPMVHFRVLP